MSTARTPRERTGSAIGLFPASSASPALARERRSASGHIVATMRSSAVPSGALSELAAVLTVSASAHGGIPSGVRQG